MARFNRSVLVIDRGDGRGHGKQINDNYLGFPRGIRASKLLQLGKKQALRFGVKFQNTEVLCAKKKHNIFELNTAKGNIASKTLIIATGVQDHYPTFPGFEKYIAKSLFWCIICDGYKSKNKKIAVVGHDDKATITAAEFLIYTKNITFLTNCEKGDDRISNEGFERLKKRIYQSSMAASKSLRTIRQDAESGARYRKNGSRRLYV